MDSGNKWGVAGVGIRAAPFCYLHEQKLQIKEILSKISESADDTKQCKDVVTEEECGQSRG